MEDANILELFWSRDQAAIQAAGEAYGPYCSRIAMNLLGSPEDAEECVSDAMLTLWEKIPPERPRDLRVYLGRVVRNIAVSIWRRENRQKRGSGLTAQLEELAECVPAPGDAQTALEGRELGRVISRWLRGLTESDRALFLRRYWYGESLRDLARVWGEPANRLSQRLFRLRASLRDTLEKEGYTV